MIEGKKVLGFRMSLVQFFEIELFEGVSKSAV